MSTEHATACPKCQHAMESGFVADNTHGGTLQSTWVDGAPVRSMWTGLKLKGHERLPVTTYRCTRCGYLESYAPDASS